MHELIKENSYYKIIILASFYFETIDTISKKHYIKLYFIVKYNSKKITFVNFSYRNIIKFLFATSNTFLKDSL